MVEKTETMELWDAVRTPSSERVKHVTFGRKFHSISTQECVRLITEALGPCGDRWGFDVVHFEFKDIHTRRWDEKAQEVRDQTRPYVVVGVTVWSKVRADVFGPLYGMNEVVSAKGVIDEDAPKKAVSDALKKGLSMLGVAADVFLGLWDDDKYVAEVKKGEQENGGNRSDQMASQVALSEKDRDKMQAAILFWSKLGDQQDAMIRKAFSHWKVDGIPNLSDVRLRNLFDRLEKEFPDDVEKVKKECGLDEKAE